ncbi:hypothetical protein ASPWEDRAFT_187512 [Aspergillus wentii DTO 134E9]|uniref:Carrier domain-containing protein n=1 Tax=Aspergillus wentii DTO 134E9 TaxID=1073089 RepID=A0A1L9R9Q8_ASPWE|nr:uncharacterized protein ASPWEDRAFT_187512 [Aspergillus wentii DTO 134E9]KAI9926304.1 hypothetical protein MW887_004068 [Aspergillus wentii]OJJ31665.1 hypothetical protein ASPWEDRAFT_187512 [Aspergillus wentii DTO 134E9]
MADVLEHNVRTIIAAQCRVPLEKVTLDADINRDLGGDMDTMAWLLVRLQQEFHLDFTADDATIRTAGEIVQYIKSKSQ